MTRILTVPGLGGSGKDHWQTIWEHTIANTSRIEQADYDRPKRATWLDAIADAIDEYGDDVVLVGHSLGAIAIVQWAARDHRAVRGALLVAPTDVDAPGAAPELSAFGPISKAPLPFPAVVVASSNDPWVSLVRAKTFADDWCAEFIDAGPAGHINAESNAGAWPQGRILLESLLEEF